MGIDGSFVTLKIIALNHIDQFMAREYPIGVAQKGFEEITETVGTRHRSVYYLCHHIPEALGLVISQDGYVRLIKWKDGRVTYWEQPNSFALKIL